MSRIQSLHPSGSQLMRSTGVPHPPAHRILHGLFDAMDDHQRLKIMPPQKQLFGKDMLVLRGRELCIRGSAVDYIGAVVRLEVLGLRMRHLAVELRGVLALKVLP